MLMALAPATPLMLVEPAGARSLHAALIAGLDRVRSGRDGRAAKIAAELDRIGIHGALEGALRYVGNPALISRAHFARFLVEAGIAKNVHDVFLHYLARGKPGYVERYSTPLKDAIALIRGAKGLAVIAHPWGRGSKDVLTGDALEKLAKAGLEGIEVDHTDHDQNTRELLTELGARTGLIRTGSSDYHGTGKVDHDLGCNTTAPEVLDAILARYMEEDQSIEQIVAAGFDRADVERVTRLIKINEYKRRQSPVGIRITHRAFGRDWRYPITSKFRA